MSTLNFATRAKKIENTAVINKKLTREQLEVRIEKLEKLNQELKKQLESKFNKMPGNSNRTFSANGKCPTKQQLFVFLFFVLFWRYQCL